MVTALSMADTIFERDVQTLDARDLHAGLYVMEVAQYLELLDINTGQVIDQRIPALRNGDEQDDTTR